MPPTSHLGMARRLATTRIMSSTSLRPSIPLSLPSSIPPARYQSTSSSPPPLQSATSPTSSSSTATATDTCSLTLTDGRTLTYATWGDPSHPPLLFLHGYPSSRLEISPLAPLLTQHSYLISPDRPGFGLSTPHPGRTIPSYAADITALLDHLKLDRVALLGGSGGGPYALACAATPSLRPRLGAVGVLAGAPPWTAPSSVGRMPLISRLGRAATYYTPGMTASIFAAFVKTTRWAAQSARGHKGMEEWLVRQGASPEGAKEARERMVRVVMEAFAQGPAAAVEEAVLLTQDWGFAFSDVKAAGGKPVRIWHGKGDARSPIASVRWMSEQMPRAELVELEGGHFDVHGVMGEVVRALMKDMEG